MSERRTAVRHVTVGLVTGVAVTVAMGQRLAPERRVKPPQGEAAQGEAAGAQAPPVVRYQIATTRDNIGNQYLVILDHQTQRIHRRSADQIGGNSPTVEQLLQSGQ